METATPETLIIGSDSVVGGALLKFIRNAGQSAIGTTRRPEQADESCLYLDLTEDAANWPSPSPKTVVVCAGITRVGACKRDPAGSRRVNVDGLMGLMRKLLDNGASVIYLSSDHVFEGSKPYYREDDPVSPVTEYGKQKAEVEHLLGEWPDSVTIVRFTKILGPQDSLFSGWVDALGKGEPIHPFKDMRMAPVPLSSVVSTLKLLIDQRLRGTYHVSGEQEISYDEAARLCARVIGSDENLVEPILSAQAGYPELVRAHTTLSMEKLKRGLGVTPPDVLWTLETAFTNPQALAGEGMQ
ncbi:MAG: sugar nucleotide-binding protein [Chloroflexi bacterium]|nr:sugar nucleotide-binding protein [Chloroflexota bacterium]